MRHMQISQATLGTFTVGLALSLAAQSAEQALRPCEQIIHACKHAGFVEGRLQERLHTNPLSGSTPVNGLVAIGT
jgi:hypothetical protein